MPTKEQALVSLAGGVRQFIDQEVPDINAWNVNPDVLADALTLIGGDFTDSDDQIAALRTLFEVDHDAGGMNPAPSEWVPEASTPLYLNGAQFSLSGDRRADYAIGHRLSATLSSADVVVSITAVSYSASPTNRTTITVASAVSASPLTSALTAIARSLVRFSAPRVLSVDLMPGAVDAAALADGAVATAKIGAGQVTGAKLADGAVATAKIGDLQVTGAKLADSAAGPSKLADGAVTNTKLGSGSVTTAKIGVAQVTSAQLAANAVTGTKIAGSAVTADKIATSALASQSLANLVRNGSFEVWPVAGDVPSFWALDAGASAAPEFATVRLDDAAVAVTTTVADRGLHQTLFQISATENTALRGTAVTVTCLARAATAGAGRIRIFDGVTESLSTSYAGGELGGSWTALSAFHTIDAAATELTVYLEASAVGVPVLFDGAHCVRGRFLTAFTPHPNDAGVTAVDYRDRTTNRAVGGVSMQSGWGFLTVSADASFHAEFQELAVAFPRTLTTVLGAHVTLLGYKQGSDPSDLTDTTVWLQTIEDRDTFPLLSVQGGSLSGTGMKVAFVQNGGATFNVNGIHGRRYVFSWSAWGIAA